MSTYAFRSQGKKSCTDDYSSPVGLVFEVLLHTRMWSKTLNNQESIPWISRACLVGLSPTWRFTFPTHNMQFEREMEAQPFNIDGVGMQKTGHGNVLNWALHEPITYMWFLKHHHVPSNMMTDHTFLPHELDSFDILNWACLMNKMAHFPLLLCLICGS